MPVKATQMTSIDQVRRTIAKGSGGGALTRIKDKQELAVRFLGEPNTWVKYSEHYTQADGFFPCADDGTCPGCADGVKTSGKFLVNAVELSEKAVIALVLTVGTAEDLLVYYDKFNTLMDRVYEISRTGTSKNDTKYRVNYREARSADLSRFEPFDLLDLINSELPSSEDIVDEDDPDDDLDGPAKVSPTMRSMARKVAGRPAPADDLDDDDFGARPAQVAKAIKKVTPPAARPATAAPAKKLLRRPGA